MKNRFLFTALFLISFIFYGQEMQISGTVTDEMGSPIFGANIVNLDTRSGSITDFDGKFEILASSGDRLEFSYIGYETYQLSIQDDSSLEVTMQEDAQSL